jgi:hypothetical protein
MQTADLSVMDWTEEVSLFMIEADPGTTSLRFFGRKERM